MPKNSRRKKTTRQHAVRKGERYMRAWRSTAPAATTVHQPPPAPPTVKVDYIAMGYQEIHHVQRVVESRGWVVPDFHDGDIDAHGMAINTQVSWDYAPAFGGIELDDDEEVVPLKPTCSFSWPHPFGAGWIEIRTAGNWGGCEQHRPIQHRVRLTEVGITKLLQLLADVEEPAVTLDPEPFMKCLADGPCADRIQQNDEGYEHRCAWMQAMLDAREDMTDQQLAELLQWEEENFGGRSDTELHDWPGWEKLIGEPWPQR